MKNAVEYFIYNLTFFLQRLISHLHLLLFYHLKGLQRWEADNVFSDLISIEKYNQTIT